MKFEAILPKASKLYPMSQKRNAASKHSEGGPSLQQSSCTFSFLQGVKADRNGVELRLHLMEQAGAKNMTPRADHSDFQ
jgi:hypothetical protein